MGASIRPGSKSGRRAAQEFMKKPPAPTAAVWLILVLALVLRVGYVVATPDYRLVHDALDYDRTAASLAQGKGYPEVWGRPTAFRPPAYPYVLGGVYEVAGVERAATDDRVLAARILGVAIGMAIVVLIGVVAWQLWGRRAGLLA